MNNKKKILITVISILILIVLLTVIIVCSIYIQNDMHLYVKGDLKNQHTVNVLLYGCTIGISGFLFLLLGFNFSAFLSSNKKWFIDLFKNKKVGKNNDK